MNTTQANDWFYVQYNSGVAVYRVTVWVENDKGQVVGKIAPKFPKEGGDVLEDVPTC